jgi:hypothetical protein
MTAALQMDVENETASTPARKSRSGSNRRQRTEQVKLSFLPAQRAVLEQCASDLGIEGPGKVQKLIMMRLGDLIPA